MLGGYPEVRSTSRSHPCLQGGTGFSGPLRWVRQNEDRNPQIDCLAPELNQFRALFDLYTTAVTSLLTKH